MIKILGSASKIVFILITISACLGIFLGKISEDNFMILAVSAFSFFFSFKGENKENLPFNGK
jgi:hypothetical protein